MATQQTPDPDADKVSFSALDFLLIELVPLAQRMSQDLRATDNNTLLLQTATSSLTSSTTPLQSQLSQPPQQQQQQQQKRSSLRSTADTGTSIRGTQATKEHDEDDEDEDDDDVREAMLWRLDALGYRVGQGLVERFSANTPRPTTHLDMIKFICKDLWTLLFKKQIDNLKTNHRGTFVLTDSRFHPLSRVSVDTQRGPKGLDEALSKAQPFLWFPCGIIRGALSGFGLNVSVQAETTELPAAVFQIRTVGSSK